MLTKKELIVILLIFAAIAVIFSSIYWLSIKQSGFKQPAEPPSAFQPLSKEEEVERTVTGVKIPEEVYAYNGLVVAVNSQSLFIKALSHNNYLQEDQDLEVLFDDEAQFIRRTLPKSIPADVKTVFAKEAEIAYNAIKVGDMVEVYSRETIKDKTKFKADVIKVLEF